MAQVARLRQRIEELSGELQRAVETISSLQERLRVEAPPSPEDSQLRRGKSRQLERQAMILMREDAMARRFQESLRPLWLGDFEGVEFAVRSVPGVRVRGDFYDVIRTSANSVVLLMADVSGCGLPATVIMAMARMAFRTFVPQESSPLAIMQKVNDALLNSAPPGHHLRAFLGLLDLDMLTFQYVNASHCCPSLIRGGEITRLDTEGFFVGMFEEPHYEQKSVQLAVGDKLFMFTDGLLSLFEDTPGETGETKLWNFLSDRAGLRLRDLMRGLNDRFSGGLEDDVAVLAMELLRERARSKTMSIASLPSEIRHVENSVLPLLRAKGWGERTLFDVKLALEEAVSNAIKHGNQLDSTKRVKVEFSADEGESVIRVEDEGEGFDPANIPDPTLDENIESSSGRGIALMRAAMDSVEHNEKGNVVTLVKASPWKLEESPPRGPKQPEA